MVTGQRYEFSGRMTLTGIFQNHLGGMRMAKTLIFLADGFEEVEALTVVDLVRRAGIEMKMVSITGKNR